MGRSSRSSSSSVSSSSSHSSTWSRASGLSDVTERGIVTRTKEIGKMNKAQKFMAYTLGIKVDSKKHHRVKAQMLQWEGFDEQGRLVTWFENPELYWTTSVSYVHDADMRPRSQASSRSGRRHHHRGPQDRKVPPPPVRPGPQMGGGRPFMPGGAGPGPMAPAPQYGGPPPPPPHHFPPGPTPMPQPGAWGQPPGVPQEAYDDETASYSSGYDSDGGSWCDDGMYGQQPPIPPQNFQPGPPPPPAAATSDTLDDGAAFIKL